MSLNDVLGGFIFIIIILWVIIKKWRLTVHQSMALAAGVFGIIDLIVQIFKVNGKI